MCDLLFFFFFFFQAEDGIRDYKVTGVQTCALPIYVIIDNTHFNPIHEWRYRDLAKEYGHKFEIVRFTDVPLEECIRRDQKRRNSVGGDVIWNMNIYRKSLRRGVVADLKRQWVAKR